MLNSFVLIIFASSNSGFKTDVIGLGQKKDVYLLFLKCRAFFLHVCKISKNSEFFKLLIFYKDVVPLLSLSTLSCRNLQVDVWCFIRFVWSFTTSSVWGNKHNQILNNGVSVVFLTTLCIHYGSFSIFNHFYYYMFS